MPQTVSEIGSLESPPSASVVYMWITELSRVIKKLCVF